MGKQKTAGSEYHGNVSYFFVPFSYARPDADDESLFDAVTDEIDANDDWEPVDDNLTYMFRYITDKIQGRNDDRRQNANPGDRDESPARYQDGDRGLATVGGPHGPASPKNGQAHGSQRADASRLCVHVRLAPGAAQRLGIPGPGEECITPAYRTHGGGSVRVRLRLLDVQLFCFSTTVCIVALKVTFDTDDPLVVATAQFHLKKCAREGFHMATGTNQGAAKLTLVDIARKALSPLALARDCEFFYYASGDSGRSNVLSFVEVPPKDDYREELFYLRRCYDCGFTFREDPATEQREIYVASAETTWGVTSEAAVCLTHPSGEKAWFIRGKFFENFNTQYLFMYVFLLHQKYTLYHFLSSIRSDDYDDLPRLKRYEQRLFEYEANFEYSRITEVPQYQKLYDRIAEAFALDALFEDVREPLQALGELKKDTAEKEARSRERNINASLLALSFLVLFSALADSFDFAGNFLFIGPGIINAIRGLCIVFIVCVAAWVVYSVVKYFKE